MLKVRNSALLGSWRWGASRRWRKTTRGPAVMGVGIHIPEGHEPVCEKTGS